MLPDKNERSGWITCFAYFLMVLGGGMAVWLTLFLGGAAVPLEVNGVAVESISREVAIFAYLLCGTALLSGWGMLRRKKWALWLYFGAWVVATPISFFGFGMRQFDLTPAVLMIILLCTKEEFT